MFSVNTSRYSMETDGNNKHKQNNKLHSWFLLVIFVVLFHFTCSFLYLTTRVPLKISRVLPLLRRMISEIVNSPYVEFWHSYISVQKVIHFCPNIEVSSSFAYSLAKFSGKDQTWIVSKQKKWILIHFGITQEKGKMFSNCMVFIDGKFGGKKIEDLNYKHGSM